jgi:hypothetical protein
MPAQAGNQYMAKAANLITVPALYWIPAFAGMTPHAGSE